MSDDVKRYSKYYDEMELEPNGDFVLFEDYERLRTELNEAADATGIAGVDEPMSLLQCIQSLREEVERLRELLQEAVDVVSGHVEDGYELDSFTVQPWKRALERGE